MILPVKYDELDWQTKREVREEYSRLQFGLCYYCKYALDGMPPDRISKKKINISFFPSGFFSYPIHLHHNHETGMTEGTVHAYCNAVLWVYERQ